MSESLFSLFTKERVSDSLAKNIFSSVFAYYAQDQIAPVALRSFALYKRATISELLTLLIYKRVTMGNSLRVLFKKEQNSKRSFFLCESLFYSQKTSDLLEKPKSKFPTLQ